LVISLTCTDHLLSKTFQVYSDAAVHRIQIPTNVFDANAQSEEHLQSLYPIALAPVMTMEETETFLGAPTATFIAQLDVSKSYKDNSKQLWHIELDQRAAEEVEAKVLQNQYKKVKVIESAQAIPSCKLKV
jgi:hypothetical protein